MEEEDALLPMTTDESDVLKAAVCEYTTTTQHDDDDFGGGGSTKTPPVGVFRLEVAYTRWELKTATALAAGRIREAIEEEQKMGKRGENFGGSGRYQDNRCAIFMDLSLIHI